MPSWLLMPTASALKDSCSAFWFPSEARCQASHRSGMEAANEAKRLAPLEPRAARLEEALRAAGVELERVQHEVTVHQQTIRCVLIVLGHTVRLCISLQEPACLELPDNWSIRG